MARALAMVGGVDALGGEEHFDRKPTTRGPPLPPWPVGDLLERWELLADAGGHEPLRDGRRGVEHRAPGYGVNVARSWTAALRSGLTAVAWPKHGRGGKSR
jgi:hypothetical protein